MEVNDVLLSSEYEPHEIKIKYKDETKELILEWEEMETCLKINLI